MPDVNLLFLCTGNSARSQMAEGFARHLAPAGVRVWSAGTQPSILHPEAVRAMRERGLDISSQRSKGLDEVPKDADVVVTLCGDAADRCPAYPGARLREHWDLPDPARVESGRESAKAFRTVRDDIERRVRDLVSRL